MKIFCMVGMHDIGFDRLLAELDAIAKRKPDWEFLIQKGYSQLNLNYARHYDFKPGLSEDIDWADIVISHGSVCILEVLKAGKKLIVVPRLALYGEHLNDHQWEWANHFSQRFSFPVVSDINTLEKVIAERIAAEAVKPVTFKPTGLFQDLRAFIESVNARN